MPTIAELDTQIYRAYVRLLEARRRNCSDAQCQQLIDALLDQRLVIAEH
jgi:hypothetical protein